MPKEIVVDVTGDRATARVVKAATGVGPAEESRQDGGEYGGAHDKDSALYDESKKKGEASKAPEVLETERQALQPKANDYSHTASSGGQFDGGFNITFQPTRGHGVVAAGPGDPPVMGEKPPAVAQEEDQEKAAPKPPKPPSAPQVPTDAAPPKPEKKESALAKLVRKAGEFLGLVRDPDDVAFAVKKAMRTEVVAQMEDDLLDANARCADLEAKLASRRSTRDRSVIEGQLRVANMRRLNAVRKLENLAYRLASGDPQPLEDFEEGTYREHDYDKALNSQQQGQGEKGKERVANLGTGSAIDKGDYGNPATVARRRTAAFITAAERAIEAINDVDAGLADKILAHITSELGRNISYSEALKSAVKKFNVQIASNVRTADDEKSDLKDKGDKEAEETPPTSMSMGRRRALAPGECSPKEKRQVEHITDSEEGSGKSAEKAKEIGYATVSKDKNAQRRVAAPGGDSEDEAAIAKGTTETKETPGMGTAGEANPNRHTKEVEGRLTQSQLRRRALLSRTGSESVSTHLEEGTGPVKSSPSTQEKSDKENALQGKELERESQGTSVPAPDTILSKLMRQNAFLRTQNHKLMEQNTRTARATRGIEAQRIVRTMEQKGMFSRLGSQERIQQAMKAEVEKMVQMPPDVFAERRRMAEMATDGRIPQWKKEHRMPREGSLRDPVATPAWRGRQEVEKNPLDDDDWKDR